MRKRFSVGFLKTTQQAAKHQVQGYNRFMSTIFNILLNDCIFISFTLFVLGMCGIVLGRKNIIIMLMSIELMLLAVNLNLLIFSVYIDDLIGQLFALLVLTVAAAEAAIGLAILVIYFRIRGTILVQYIHFIKG